MVFTSTEKDITLSGNLHFYFPLLRHFYSIIYNTHNMAILTNEKNEFKTLRIEIEEDLDDALYWFNEREKILSTISEREIGEKFWHEQNGLHFVDDIELLIDFENKNQKDSCLYKRA